MPPHVDRKTIDKRLSRIVDNFDDDDDFDPILNESQGDIDEDKDKVDDLLDVDDDDDDFSRKRDDSNMVR